MDHFQLWLPHRLKLVPSYASQQMVTGQTLENWCTSKSMVCERNSTLNRITSIFVCFIVCLQSHHVLVFNLSRKPHKKTNRCVCCANRKVTDQFAWNGVCWTGHCSTKWCSILATITGPWRRMTRKAEHFLSSKLTLSELAQRWLHSTCHWNSNWSPIVTHSESKRFLLKQWTRRQTTSTITKREQAMAAAVVAARARHCLLWIPIHSYQCLQFEDQVEKTHECMSAKQATILDGLSRRFASL